MKNLLLLSHGQASVERGFSINKEIEVENLAEESVVAQRVICDTVMSLGGIHNVDISKSLLASAAAARQQYINHLEEKNAEEKEEKKLKKNHVI